MLMYRGTGAPVGVEQADGFEQQTGDLQNNRPIRRLLAVALATAQIGLVAAGIKEIQSSDSGCIDATCYAALDHLDVPGVTGTDGIDPTTTAIAPPTVTESPTTAPPITESPTTTAAPPPPPPAPQSLLPSIEIAASAPAQPAELPPRQLPYDIFIQHHETMLANIPTLDRLNQLFPNSPMTHFVAEQKQRIAELDAAITPTVEEYNALNIDMSRSAAFADSANYHGSITPKAFIIHWTAEGYDNVDHFVASLKPYRVEFFIDKNAQSYQLFERDTNVPAHGLSLNGFSQGVEIETGQYDGAHSPLFSYQPQQLENAVHVAVRFLRRNNLPVDATTLLGHYAADLIFTNPYYDPLLGSFSQNRVRKFDPPQELMHVLVAKAQQLDAALGPR